MVIVHTTSDKDIGSPDSLEFERGVTYLLGQIHSSTMDDVNDFLCHILRVIDFSTTLTAREKERRLRVVINKLLPSNSLSYKKIAVASQELSSIVKNALNTVLPPEFIPLMYHSLARDLTEISAATPALVAQSQFPIDVAPTAKVSEVAPTDWNVVLLLGTNVEHDGNLSVLRSDFAPIRVTDLSMLENLLDQRICGIVVGSSWWTLIDSDKHEAFLFQIASYSHFAYLKVNFNGLINDTALKLTSIFASSRYKQPTINEVSVCEGSILNTVDIENLKAAQRLLCATNEVRIHPAAIKDDLGTLLLAATMKRIDGYNPDTSLILRKLDCSFLPGGKSGSMILLLQPAGYAAPFVAKVDKESILRNEMNRFKTFIGAWDTQLRPEYFAHGKNAVIFFGMVGDAGRSDAPAPTLFSRLEEIYWLDFSGNDVRRIEDNLKIAILRTVNKIEMLAKKPNKTTLGTYGWITCENIDKSISRGIEWTFISNKIQIDVRNVLEKSVAILNKLKNSATIHGDVNLRNILVTDDLNPFLIDYACSGPGHPCYDLVRFESAVIFTFFRMLKDEESITELIKDITLTDCTFEDLSQKYQTLLTYAVNRLALYSAIEARDAALRSISQYGGDRADYLAMKLVVAFQSLTIIELQQCVVRATISAIASEI